MTTDAEFDAWNARKKELHSSKPPPYYHPREVWWCALGVGVGYEQAGKGENFARPVVVLRKFGSLFYGVPLSTTQRRGAFYHAFYYNGTTESVALLTQMRVLDSRRLIRKDGMMSKGDFAALQAAVGKLLK